MNLVFKKASLLDVEDIVNLCNRCFDEETTLDFAKKVFNETQNDSNQIYLVGILDNIMVAHTKITLIPTIFNDMNTYAILNHVCVDPEYRRKGIATQMLEEVVKVCKDLNCKSLKLWSNNYRNDAHGCYHHYGFILNDAGFFSKDI